MAPLENPSSLASQFVAAALKLSLAASSEEKSARREVSSVRQRTRQLAPGEITFQFLSEAVRLIRDEVASMPRESNGSFSNSVYRAFDELDGLFGLDYASDKSMTAGASLERVYAGAGVGVQSSYATILRTFELIPHVATDRWADLGSGFGRVGLTLGCLRPENPFVGYEIIPHRVAMANAAASRAGLQPRVNFEIRDLSERDFVIPEADIYYMWDPFTKETYQNVLAQLKHQARFRKISVVAKGEAATWMQEIASSEPGWTQDRTHDGGNLGLFISGGS
jgi:hypothetical protein